jgi:hypothetical protein
MPDEEKSDDVEKTSLPEKSLEERKQALIDD